MGMFSIFRRERVVYDDIVCPYCFERFSNLDVQFRAPDSQGLEADENLSKFYKDFAGVKSTQQYGKVIDPNVTQGTKHFLEFTDSDKVKHKMLSGFTPNGERLRIDKRICPHCHNTLPMGSGNGKCTVISVIGYTQIGKTFYINSLISSLMKIYEKFPDMICTFVTESMRSAYIKTKNNIENGFQEATNVNYIEPLIIQLENTKEHRATVISFYDFPGEADVNAIEKYSKNQILKADGLLILFDLTQTATFSESFVQSQINDEIRKKSSAIEKFGSTDDAIEKLLLFIDALGVNIASMNKDLVEKEIFELEAKKIKYQAQLNAEVSDYQLGKLNEQIADINQKISDKKKKLTEMEEMRKAVSDKFKEIIGREIKDGDLCELYSIQNIEKRIERLNQDMLHVGQYFNGQIYTDKLSAGDWLATRYAEAMGAAAMSDKRPVAIVGTKSDEVYSMITQGCGPHINGIEHAANILFADVPTVDSRFNENEAIRISAFVEKQLLTSDGYFKNVVKGKFEEGKYSYFAVSALGTKFENEEKVNKDGTVSMQKTLVGAKINPWRVDEPMLWLLHRLGVIK